MPRLFLLLSLTVAGAALAQEATPPPSDFSTPPMVPATPPPTPAAEPGAALIDPNAVPATPPPPGTVPPPGYQPGGQPSPYPYSPYGNPKNLTPEKPPVEWGYMISESLFGMLTSAGVTLLPYFLLLRPMVTQNANILGNDPAIDTTIFVLLFSAVPLAVMQTQVALANGSKYYFSESWPAALAGLGAQAAVLGLFFAVPRNPAACGPGFPCASEMSGRNEILLLVGSVAFVPLVQMAVINLTKSPRMARMGGLTRDDKGKIALNLPTMAPYVAQTRLGPSVGMQASLLNFNW